MFYNVIRNLITKRKSEDNMSLTNGAVTYRNLSDVDAGKVVSFVYYGHGENYGQLRQATVLEILGDGILAQEKNSNHPKHFKNAEAEDVKLEEDNSQNEFETSTAKGVTFIDAKQMLEEAGWANEVVLDSLSSEQLVEIYGAYHTVRENAEAGDYSYDWDATNGNILIHDHTNPIFVTSLGHDGMFAGNLTDSGAVQQVSFRITNNDTNEWQDFRITVDQSGKVTLQENGNVISAVALTKSLLNLIEG